MFNVHQIILGSIGYKVLWKTLCPVVVVFLCCGWLRSIYIVQCVGLLRSYTKYLLYHKYFYKFHCIFCGVDVPSKLIIIQYRKFHGVGLMLHIKRSKTRSILIGDKLDDIGSSQKQVQGSLRHVQRHTYVYALQIEDFNYRLLRFVTYSIPLQVSLL